MAEQAVAHTTVDALRQQGHRSILNASRVSRGMSELTEELKSFVRSQVAHGFECLIEAGEMEKAKE